MAGFLWKLVIWTPEALEDLEGIRDYVFAVAPDRTSAVLSGIIGAVRNLPYFPHSGRSVPQLERSDVREVIAGSYRIVYRIAGDTVWILRVSHGAQDLTEWFGQVPQGED